MSLIRKTSRLWCNITEISHQTEKDPSVSCSFFFPRVAFFLLFNISRNMYCDAEGCENVPAKAEVFTASQPHEYTVKSVFLSCSIHFEIGQAIE